MHDAVQGLIQGRLLSVLIDSGNTHNFINYGLVKQLNCRVQPSNTLKVLVVDDNKLECVGICKDVMVDLKWYQFFADRYPLNLKGLDVVLAIQWLQDLGPAVCNWR